MEGITASNLGRQILPIVNGHAMQPLRLYSKPVTSGKLAVMGGFSPADLAAMAEFIPRRIPREKNPSTNWPPLPSLFFPARTLLRKRRRPKTLKNTKTVP
ncbi:hypothetical protein M5E88_04350 [Akkermansia muciniphila]|nr:hypothetical protein M5E88_04350 [Akkermansia muciniphila]